MDKRTLVRFMAKVQVTDGCWLWTASARTDGYGQFRHLGYGTTPGATHRLSYEHHVGPIPEGMHVLHRCDVKRCVRPDHLYVGDRSDNMQDAADRGLNRRPGGFTNLTSRERESIRLATGSLAEIAAATGRSKATVWRVRNGR
jgi:hypothetical protein